MKRLPLEELQPYSFPEAVRGEAPPPVDWQQVFGNSNPVEVEVGFGKGLFLLTASSQHPEINYFGIEIVRKYQLVTATRLALKQVRNVKVACADAKIMFGQQIAPGTVQAVHIYFPDPWWKKRHNKRRLFTPEFACDCGRVLKLGGKLHLVTDVADYFAMEQETMQGLPSFRECDAIPESRGEHDFDYLTNFERKFRKEGRPIHRVSYEKVA
ncbi:tRNA (guanosine(46)-N7)-methyltransferase TrmB [Telmatocola sphagniphila]|jgi:tRNA (guanine-N7-)-methyltransferase|nr:tRNA (guanosine(46)-N7)-methyltransferase TrmB [Telmatocola sphagniphila]